MYNYMKIRDRGMCLSEGPRLSEQKGKGGVEITGSHNRTGAPFKRQSTGSRTCHLQAFCPTAKISG